MKRELRIKVALAALALASIMFLVGCLVQPTDAKTGKPFGDPVSPRNAPAVSPDGNPVANKPTTQPDTETMQSFANFLPPPWNLLASAGIGMIAWEAGRRKLTKKKAQ